ncbi:ATP-dependent DNA helicase Q-like 4A isoform X1 [Zingiber officinale]|uniref:ATP-dependent DNA helicase Q-like 4A isoform X1 n=1 Tax=Zingiber officinale TaxID=94328 RepID=UPI001C4C4FAF|nr:ATP-dependent DNA helicase Q-like 4A isoform X1 [Zingiber officinale]XP_042440832.1 ATP-dependent DNA helicase Q-like 4A isoform X1 [Zingiber officinale]
MTDPINFNSQAYIRNEPGDTMTWSSPTPSCYANQFGTTSAERQVFTPKLLDINYIEGSGDKKWKSLDFPWTKKLEANNRKVFGNHSFHPNQREVINATMSGCDVFVLMPTGGGKSLTYQANIPATYLGANIEWAEQQDIFREVMSDVCKYKLQYVTPEKIANCSYGDIQGREMLCIYWL